ncbi:hypothetical protein CBS63078_8149 [Aspergillus niger]|nr:hypothetical protein CBS133816_9899 [Aspergillus niger]KAI2823725.1 hypothetical protein CBS115989_1314 [Aspergillus niger]KAI2858746.1 hypothetical protein CBS11232_2512 [Aspergillus niger]KAI2869631.1 hypothetical protein CBS115988_9887 [Aspergillus niger]KAI2896693.1 hypothetical protein CBS63078_8149 [Aspergillus niger]
MCLSALPSISSSAFIRCPRSRLLTLDSNFPSSASLNTPSSTGFSAVSSVRSISDDKVFWLRVHGCRVTSLLVCLALSDCVLPSITLTRPQLEKCLDLSMPEYI